jgi:hypothetical protein
VSSRTLVALTLGGTLIMALMSGFAMFVPHMLAEGLMLVYVDAALVRRLYLRARMMWLQRDYRRRTAHLHVVDRDQDERPRWTH